MQILFLIVILHGIRSQTIEDEYQEPVPSNSTESTYTRNVKQFIAQNSIKSGVIVSQFLPIKYNKMNYYWRGYYNHNSNDSLRCDYTLSDADQEFRDVRYPDGSRPHSLKFRCQNNEKCCGLECCGESRSSMFIVGGIVVFFLALYWVINKYRKYGKKSESSNDNATQPLSSTLKI